MGQHLLRALGGTTAIVILSSLLGTAPAQAREADRRPGPLIVHARAIGPDHFTSQATVEVPAGGTANVVSPTMTKTMTKATVTVSTPLSDEPGFDALALGLLAQPTPGKRLMACITMAKRGMAVIEFAASMNGELDVYEALEAQIFAARLQYCMRVAALVASVLEQSGRQRAASACGTMAPVGIPTKVTKTSNGYSVVKDGEASVKKKNAKVKVTCSVVSATKVKLVIKPKKKGSTLRKALRSKKLGVSLGSAEDASSGATTTVAFASP